MPRKAQTLTAAAVARLPEGRHHVGGCPGLALAVGPERRSRSWVLRVRVGGRPRELGLGGADEVSLADARRRGRELRERLRRGEPLETKAPPVVTFRQAADAWLKAFGPHWTAKRRQQVSRRLETVAAPLHAVDVSAVTTADVLALLEAHWEERPTVVRALRADMQHIFELSAARGWRPADAANPAEAARVKVALPLRYTTRAHAPAVPVSEAAGVYAALLAQDSEAARVCAFVALTGCRVAEALGMRPEHVDADARVWVQPAALTKQRRQHRVPLSAEAARLFEGQKARPGRRVWAATHHQVSGALRRAHAIATPHGWRACLRAWLAERGTPHHLAEMCLAHNPLTAVESAYLRTDALQQRRPLMDAWASYLLGGAK